MVVAGIALSMLAFFGIAMTQVSRAVIDSAETSREMLEIARLGMPQQTGNPTASPEPVARIGGEATVPDPLGNAARSAEEPAKSTVTFSMNYKGFRIYRDGDYILVDAFPERKYARILAAERDIDAALLKATQAT